MVGMLRVFPLILFLFGGKIQAKISGSPILEYSLEEFLDQIVKPEEREGFRVYYSQFLEKQSRARPKTKNRYLRRKRAEGLQQLREFSSELYGQLEPYVLDLDAQTSESRKVRLCLIRFALLKEYRSESHLQSEGWFDAVKRQAKKIGNKLASVKNRVFKKDSSVKA